MKLWDAVTGRELLSLTGHRRPPTGVRFDRAGCRLLSWTGVSLWDLFTEQGGNSQQGESAEVKFWDALP